VWTGIRAFFTSDFESTEEAKVDEIQNTALCFGFSRAQVEMAIGALIKPNEELKVDDVLKFLNANFAL